MAIQEKVSYLIVGGGVFGASTAYHLSKAHPKASIILVDRSESFPCQLAASNDLNKIVRTDYNNIFYCELALKARELWTNDPLYKPYFHQTGVVWLEGTGLGKKIMKNYETLNSRSEGYITSPDEFKKMYDGNFQHANYEGVGPEDIYVNPLSGWAEATSAVRNVIEAAIMNGVQYVEGDIETLCFESGACSGVKTTRGDVLLADKVILSTGAGTAKLIADSAPDRPDIQVGDRITAAAVVTGMVKLNKSQMERFKNIPVFVHAMDSVLGEVLPPTADGVMKFNESVSFKNTSKHLKSGQVISAPPDGPNQAQHTVPQSLQHECHRVVRGIYGKELQEYEFDDFRICWDGITPNQDFIISVHPRCENLYIATAGSFHGWKFLPILGEYVVKLLDGKLEEELVKRWAWDRDQSGSAHSMLIPKRELSDLL
ncbi:hypothetical protein B7494_g4343 [Chlorociboria aeruginascens]|nr:hypothetical protein B7494_g4343 [Chlorociboria aeruginascens]